MRQIGIGEALANSSSALLSAACERPLDLLPWILLPLLVEAAAQLRRDPVAKAVKWSLAEDVKPTAHKAQQKNKRAVGTRIRSVG